MSELNRIPEREENSQAATYNMYVTNKEKPQTMNTVLYILVGVIFVALLSTYFVRELPDVIVDIRNVTGQVLWLFIGSFSIGELFKAIYSNKARETKEYTDQKKETEKRLKEVSEKGTADDRNAYCREYEETLYNAALKYTLDNGNLTLEQYALYKGLNEEEICERFPCNDLSQKQKQALKKANKLKRIKYNVEFFNLVETQNAYVAPSDLFDTKKENLKNFLFSAFFGFIGLFFGVSITHTLIFDFSASVIFAAIIKIISTLIIVAFKATFGWNLVIKTEINRMKVQEKEGKNYCAWYDKKMGA